MKTLLILFLSFSLTHTFAQNSSKNDQKQGNVASTQCKGTTHKGERCKRKTHDKSGYCYQHQKTVKK